MATQTIVGELYRRTTTLESGTGRGDTGGRVEERVFRAFSYNDLTGQVVKSSSSTVLDELASQEGVTLGSTFPGLSTLECYEIRPEEQDEGESEWHWIITCSYKVPDEEDQPDDFDEFLNRSSGPGSDDPTNPFGPKRDGGGQVMDEYWIEDLDGKKFFLPTGIPFQNVPPIPITIQVFRITVNERVPGDTSRIGVCDGKFMLANVTYKENTHVNKSTGVRTKYYENSYEVWFHPYRKFSRVKLLCYGFQAFYRDGNNVELRACRVNDNDLNSDFVADPVALDKNGFRKPHNQGQAVEPDWIEFRIRDEGPLRVPFF